MPKSPKIKQVLYKCLAKGCEIKLEKHYLFCSIECACYNKYMSARYDGGIKQIFRLIIQKIIFTYYLITRTIYEYFRT